MVSICPPKTAYKMFGSVSEAVTENWVRKTNATILANACQSSAASLRRDLVQILHQDPFLPPLRNI
ncbi:hypothetical protein T01_10066 [Trichinella spiralis]|uniref:Uncharacterized protein n=1 Tax=Trichinella spiralis TaxID=6334 RepID=A0A0V1BK17_TRISP|nr:hypothetical protein T01_10066 [Trichinella spiralis]